MDEQTTRRAVIGLKHSRRANGLFLLAILGYLVLPVSWLIVPAVAAVGAVGAQAKAFRAFSVIDRSAGLRTMSVLAMVASSLLALLALAPMVADLAAPERRECEKGANTAAAVEACRARFGQAPGERTLFPWGR